MEICNLADRFKRIENQNKSAIALAVRFEYYFVDIVYIRCLVGFGWNCGEELDHVIANSIKHRKRTSL